MAKMHPMKSMELSDEESLDAVMPIPMADKPKYPWGLKICLTEKEFEKLGIDPEEACVGGIFHLHALARITSVSKNEHADGDECVRVEAQIEDMCVESEDDENEEVDATENNRPKRSPLYG